MVFYVHWDESDRKFSDFIKNVHYENKMFNVDLLKNCVLFLKEASKSCLLYTYIIPEWLKTKLYHSNE